MKHKKNGKFPAAAVLRTSAILMIYFLQVQCDTLVEQEFTPAVTATCSGEVMTIRVITEYGFTGSVHARDYRRPECTSFGDGSKSTELKLNLVAGPSDPNYCGIRRSQKTNERSLPIAVRIHRGLELADDKYYVISCGKPGFKNSRNETSLVSLKLLDGGVRVTEVVEGRKYVLRADVTRPDRNFGIKVKSCFSFSGHNNTVILIDDRGCPAKKIITRFHYDEITGTADAVVYMLKFPDSNKVHFQCDIVVCKGKCGSSICEGDPEPPPSAQARALSGDASENGIMMAAMTVFVVEPGVRDGEPVVLPVCEDCGINPPWLLYLCIALGILFLIMIIINIFLCSAMTCSCTKTEVVEKEPSIIREYDPYSSWQGSYYGSRQSLDGKPVFASNSSTLNSRHSDYGIVHSRPGSRHSALLEVPRSAAGSHYSGRSRTLEK